MQYRTHQKLGFAAIVAHIAEVPDSEVQSFITEESTASAPVSATGDDTGTKKKSGFPWWILIAAAYVYSEG